MGMDVAEALSEQHAQNEHPLQALHHTQAGTAAADASMAMAQADESDLQKYSEPCKMQGKLVCYQFTEELIIVKQALRFVCRPEAEKLFVDKMTYRQIISISVRRARRLF